MQQFFVSESLEEKDTFELSEEISHQLIKVLRVRSGDQIRIIDSNQNAFVCEIHPQKKKVLATVIRRLVEQPESSIKVILALAKIKKDKWEWALQKATELGVHTIIPMKTNYVNVKDFRDEEKMANRHQKILQEAAEQSERHVVPKLLKEANIDELCDFRTFLKESNMDFENPLAIVCYERSEGKSEHLATLLYGLQNDFSKMYDSVLIFIGPEGGFTEQEIEKFITNDVTCVALGPRILRAETAALLSVGLCTQILEKGSTVSDS